VDRDVNAGLDLVREFTGLGGLAAPRPLPASRPVRADPRRSGGAEL